MMRPKPSPQYAEIIDGTELRDRREEIGKTLRQVADEIGRPKSISFLWRLEMNRHHTCTLELAWHLALALQITPREMKNYFRFHGVDATFHRAAA